MFNRLLGHFFSHFSLRVVLALWLYDSITSFASAIRGWFMEYLGWIVIVFFVIAFIICMRALQLHLLALPGAQ